MLGWQRTFSETCTGQLSSMLILTRIHVYLSPVAAFHRLTNVKRYRSAQDAPVSEVSRTLSMLLFVACFHRRLFYLIV